jgi:hypothetical protein
VYFVLQYIRPARAKALFSLFNLLQTGHMSFTFQKHFQPPTREAQNLAQLWSKMLGAKLLHKVPRGVPEPPYIISPRRPKNRAIP